MVSRSSVGSPGNIRAVIDSISTEQISDCAPCMVYYEGFIGSSLNAL
jgi:hypothetical protein